MSNVTFCFQNLSVANASAGGKNITNKFTLTKEINEFLSLEGRGINRTSDLKNALALKFNSLCVCVLSHLHHVTEKVVIDMVSCYAIYQYKSSEFNFVRSPSVISQTF